MTRGIFYRHSSLPQVQGTTTATAVKYATYSSGERGYFIREIISPGGVKKTDEMQASPGFAHASAIFTIIFFLNISLPWGITARIQPQESSPTFDKVSELE